MSSIVPAVFRLLLCVVIAVSPTLGNAKSKKASLKIDRRGVQFLGDCAGKVRAQRDGTITINLDQAFLIESTESARQRKICLLNLSMSLPKGWQMAINEVEFNGMAAIEKDGRGELALRHRFAGTAGVAVSKEIGQTDAIEDFQAKAPIGVTDNSFSPCGGEFQFKTSLTAQVLNGAIAIASGDRGAASIVYRSTFRECNR